MNIDLTFDYELDPQLAERLVALHKKHDLGYTRDDANAKLEIERCITCMMHEAAEEGYLDVLQHMHENGLPWTKEAFEVAAEKGHLNVLQYLHAHGCPRDDAIGSIAAFHGHLNCVQFALENGYNTDDVCDSAAVGGHLNCLKYAHEHGAKLPKHTNGGHPKFCRLYLRSVGVPDSR